MKVFCFILFFWGTILYGETEYGSRILNHKNLENLTHNGFLQTYESDFTEFLHVNGSFQGSRSQIYELKVNGDTRLHECVIHGPLVVKGSLNADHSVFRGPLDLTCKSATFERCAVTEDIVVNNVANYEGKQIIKLTRGAVVQGNITFDSKRGEVRLSKDSRVNGGVIGGHIQLFVE